MSLNPYLPVTPFSISHNLTLYIAQNKFVIVPFPLKVIIYYLVKVSYSVYLEVI